MTTNYREILRLKSLGLNKTDITRSVLCARNTVSATIERRKPAVWNGLCRKESGSSSQGLRCDILVYQESIRMNLRQDNSLFLLYTRSGPGETLL